MPNSDDLGEKGENRFREICADSGLICNKSERDRAGWDFIVEFPFPDPTKDYTLDKRGPPLSCHVQVKTIWLRENARFSMRLSSAERLAKELKPAFIYVLRVSEDLTFADSYLIHVADDVLESILKRLRKEELKKTKAINRIRITMDASEFGTNLPVNGISLRTELLNICGSDAQLYVERKFSQLGNIGYTSGRHTINLEIRIKKDDAADVFLGLKSAEIVKYEEIETRFGIPLPLPIHPAITNFPFQIDPLPFDVGTATIRGGDIVTPVVLTAETFAPVIPGLPDDQQKYLIKTQFIDFVIQFPSMTASTKDVFRSRLKIKQWIDFFKMRSAISSGSGHVQFKFTRGIGLNINFKIPYPRDEESLQDSKYILSILESIHFLLSHSGEDDFEIDLESIESSETEVRIARKFLESSEDLSPITFEIPAAPDVSGSGEAQVLYAKSFNIGDQIFAYCGNVTFHGWVDDNRVIWKSGTISPIRIEKVNNPSSYINFIEDVMKETGLKNKFIVPYSTES